MSRKADFSLHCFLCDTTDNLVMIAHRNGMGHVIGWILVCDKCGKKVAGKELQISLKESL